MEPIFTARRAINIISTFSTFEDKYRRHRNIIRGSARTRILFIGAELDPDPVHGHRTGSSSNSLGWAGFQFNSNHSTYIRLLRIICYRHVGSETGKKSLDDVVDVKRLK